MLINSKIKITAGNKIMTRQIDIPDKSHSWQIFERIAPSYDLVNQILSLGLHTHWRRSISKALSSEKNRKVIDIATGTGDVALIIADEHPYTEINGIDMSLNMLRLAEKKVKKHGLEHKIFLNCANASKLSFPSGHFDAATCAFGIRNMPQPALVLREIYRVLKKGGTLLILEFSRPSNTLIWALASFYLRNVVPFTGRLFSGDKKAYTYFSNTIEQFYPQNKFISLLKKTGYKSISVKKMTAGMVSLYIAEKHDD
jgi:demethylmenaquinone methyltransferase/2-methoxy-6-polyprenyl-1,4-benzoquinol methylase